MLFNNLFDEDFRGEELKDQYSIDNDDQEMVKETYFLKKHEDDKTSTASFKPVKREIQDLFL